MRTIALLLFAASTVHGAEPRFQVENKTTPFVVVNKTAPKNYTPPGCAQCNTGNNQCACPLHYGSCRCGEVVKVQPVEVRPSRPFPVGYPGFSLTPTTNAMPAAGRSTSYPASTRTGLIRIGAPAAMYGGTSGCLTGG